VRGPVVGVQELAGLGIHGGVPEVDGLRVVDRDLPGEPQAVLGRLPAELGRDRLVGDAAPRDDGLVAAAAQDAEPGRLGEVELVRGSLDRLGGGQLGVAGGVGQAGDERPGCEEHAPVARDADRRVATEDLEAPEALVQVDVRRAARPAGHDAGHEEITDVGGSDAELVRVLAHVLESDGHRIRRRLAGIGCGHCARHERERE
jgi:hypothetical protein